jgi:GNAT superfamily N-acetyltransferase
MLNRGEKMPDDIRLGLMSDRDDEKVFALVERGFREFVQADCTAEGVEMFFEAVRYILYERPDNYFTVVAKKSETVVGMISVGDYFHISLFFVDRAHQRRHLGRRLFEDALERCGMHKQSPLALDVHSSLFAVPVYQKLGFQKKGGVDLKNGIRFVRMLYQNPDLSSQTSR